MTKKLKAAQLPVPEGVLSQHIALLGKTRSGKSSKARVLVEWLLEQGRPVCIIDPKGDWYGLKLAADGRGPGYAIVIFGGQHADISITEKHGAAVAEFVASSAAPTLIDLSGWTMGARTRFFIDFASTFFRLSKGQRHLMIDEVHNFAPKGKVHSPDAGLMLHWACTLASEGQGKGIRLIAASQRPQKVHNDVLGNCETLIACRVILDADRGAYRDWISGAADMATGKQVLDSVSNMKRHEAWVWSPEIEYGPKLVEWPMFSTFDSFKPQEEDAAPLTGWAQVDLAGLREKLGAIVAAAEASDPKKLREKVAELEKVRAGNKQEIERLVGITQDLQAQLTAAQVPAIDAAKLQELQGLLAADLSNLEEALAIQVRGLEGVIGMVRQSYASARRTLQAFAEVAPAAAVKGAPVRKPMPPAPRPAAPAAAQREPFAEAEKAVGSAHQRILGALAWWEAAMGYSRGFSRVQVAFLASYTVAGRFNRLVGELKNAGLLEYPNDGELMLTTAGRAQAPAVEAPGSQDHLHAMVLAKLEPSQQKILRCILNRGRGQEVSRNKVAEETDYAVAGRFNRLVGNLKTLGLITYPSDGFLEAAEFLFL